ncbi:MAG: sigma-70 family RNA polymerase sigma factor [Acidimicrobiales bacterium]
MPWSGRVGPPWGLPLAWAGPPPWHRRWCGWRRPARWRRPSPSAGGRGRRLDLGDRLATDPAAWRECYAVHAPMVLGYLKRLVPAADAEDALQQAFLDVWRSRDRYAAARPLEPWLLGIARRRAIDHLRKLGRRADDRAVDVPDEVPSPEAFADQFADAVTVRGALAGLPDDQREALVLAYFGGLSQSQIAERLGVPLGTVKARSFRGLRALAGVLVPQEDPS